MCLNVTSVRNAFKANITVDQGWITEASGR